METPSDPGLEEDRPSQGCCRQTLAGIVLEESGRANLGRFRSAGISPRLTYRKE